jgi:hypothetical protein
MLALIFDNMFMKYDYIESYPLTIEPSIIEADRNVPST